MRRLLATSYLVVLAACGSSDPAGVVTPPPPSSPSATPAAVAISAGSGQQAEPGAAVAVKPAVLVTDASGLPVSGVTVTFAVDSGGGSLSTTSAVTGSNGIATAGTWTLGSAEGRNILRVTVGSLAVLRIAATAVVAGSNFPATTIGTGGGSITISQAGPLNGFTLDVPGGAFAASMTATVSYTSNATIPRTPTVNPLSPLITISTTTTDFATAPLSIHISAPIPANTFPVIMVYDPASGASEVLSTTVWDANGVTATTTTLNGAQLLSARGASLRGKVASLQGNGVTVYLDAMPDDVLMRDYDSGFRPGVDDWEFPATATELLVATDVANPLGPSATAIWYYLKHPSPVKLNGRFMLQPGVPLSDRAGIRWAAIVGDENDAQATNAVVHALFNNTPGTTLVQYSQNQFMLMRAKFAHDAENGGTPQPQLLGAQTPPEAGETMGQSQFLIAYRVSGDRIYVADPFWPGDATRSLEFPSGAGMAPYANAGGGHTATLAVAAVVGLTSLMQLDQLPATYAQVLDGSIGNTRFPTNELHGWNGRLFDTLFVVDTLRMWVECAHCTNGFSTTLSPAPTANITSGAFYRLAPTINSLGPFPTDGYLFAPNLVAGTDVPAGIAVYSAIAPQQNFAQDRRAGWLDWHPFIVRKLLTSISPAAPSQTPTTPLSLTMQVTTALLPAHVNYSWDFGDNTVKTVVADNPAVQHTYAAVGNYTATCEIIDVRNNQAIARSSTPVTIDTPPIWRFTSVALTSETGPSPVTSIISLLGNFDATALSTVKASISQIITTPSDGLLLYLGPDYRSIIGPVPNTDNDVIQLQLAPAGTGNTITRLASSGVTGYALGFCAGTNCAGGPTTTFITSTGTDLSGALSGLQLQSQFPFCHGNPPACVPFIVGNWTWWQMSATKVGTTMSGTITYTQMMANDSTTRFVGPHVVTWTYTAKMVP